MASWNYFRWRRDSSPKVARRQLPVKLSLEYLEQRLAPATFTVQHFNDSVTDPGSLRYALTHLDTGTAANTNTINIDLVDNFPPASPILETAANGGGLTITQGVTINGNGTTIDGNNAFTVFTVNSGVNVVLSDLTITHGNNDASNGGGVLNEGMLTVNDSTFFDNNVGDYGGGIYNAGTLTVSDSTFADNTAGSLGGGIYNTGTLTVSDSTVSGNFIIVGNGGGIFNSSGTATLNGDVIVGNSINGNANDIAGGNADVSASSSDNVIGTGGSDGLTDGTNGNQVGVTSAQVALAPLGNYGGPTQTFALLPGSVAIGKGTTETGTTDQRGAQRPTTEGDAGAFQDQGYTFTATSGSGQSTMVNTTFAQPLVVTLTENFAHSPLPGAKIDVPRTPVGPFIGPPPPGATLTTALTDANGQAMVTATANDTPGAPYIVALSDTPLIDHSSDVVTFTLTNIAGPNAGNVVLTGAVGDQLDVQQAADGVIGDIFYTITNADGIHQPTTLTGVTSLTFQGAGNNVVTINLPSNGQALVSGPISINGAVTLNLEANGLIVKVAPGGFSIADPQTVTYSNVGTINIDGAAAVNAIADPDTADRATAFTGLSANERFVQALYLDELGRAGAQSELDSWVAVLNGIDGATAVASDIEHSFEAQDHLVKSWYVNYLGRPAVAGEELGFVNLLQQGQTEEQVLSHVLASTEFYNDAQTLIGGTNAQQNYVQALYQVLLNRTGETSGVASFVNALPQVGQQGVALDFLTSTEFRTDDFEAYYNALLHRPDDSASLNSYVFSNLDVASVRVVFEASLEFFING